MKGMDWDTLDRLYENKKKSAHQTSRRADPPMEEGTQREDCKQEYHGNRVK